MRGNLRLLNYTTAMVLAGGLLATGALAAVISSTGGAVLRVDNRSNNATQNTSAPNTFVDVTGASVPVSIAAGSTRLIRARFTADGRCDGGGAGSNCIARIVAINTGTMAVAELSPVAGTDFVFAPANGQLYGARAMERSKRLAAGNYLIKVQFGVTGIMVGHTVDDWHFTVETIQ